MRLEERRTIKVLLTLLVAGAIGAVLSPFAIYFFGLWLAPPRPEPETTSAPPIVLDALWARADGGRAAELRPLNPINFVQPRVCRALAARYDDPRVRGERRAECLKQLPAIQGIDYLSGVHMTDHHVEPRSFRMGISQVATATWLTRSWTKEEFLNTLAARGQFGYGWRGVTAAARGYFGRDAAALTLPQAAWIVARISNSEPDPWCDPDTTIEMRNRVLTRMRDNGAISETDFQLASVAALELAPPPDGRPPCPK